MHYASAGQEHGLDAAKLYAAAAEEADAAGAVELAGKHMKKVIDIARQNGAVADQLPVYLAHAAFNTLERIEEATDSGDGVYDPDEIAEMRAEADAFATEVLELLEHLPDEENGKSDQDAGLFGNVMKRLPKKKIGQEERDREQASPLLLKGISFGKSSGKTQVERERTARNMASEVLAALKGGTAE